MPITNGDMKLARTKLRTNVAQIDPAMVDYIDWDAFEGVLEAVLMNPNATNSNIDQVFKSSIAKAQLAFLRDRGVKPTN